MHRVCWQTRSYTPSKIVCVGRNYVRHIEELGNTQPDEPVLFIKPNSAITETLRHPGLPCRYETELAFLWDGGRLAAVAPGLDLTLESVQEYLKSNRLPWERAKAFDGSALFGPFVTFGDIHQLTFTLKHNEALQQEGSTGLMIFKPEQLLSAITGCFTLEPGDIIMTGTPAGVSGFAPGDRLVAAVYENGSLLTTHGWTATG